MKKIEKHKIYSSFLVDLNFIARELLNAKEQNKKAVFSERQEILNNLFDYLTEIFNKEKDIRIAKIFLKNHKTIGINNKEIRTREDYVKYHVEFYQINIIGIFDRILHLINFIYKLGLADRYVKKDIICSNINIPSKLITLIKKFDKDIETIRGIQNTSKHKKKIYIPELYNASLLDFTLKQWNEIKKNKINVNFNWTKKDEKQLKIDSNFYYDSFLKKEREKINEINKKLNKNILDIFDILYPALKTNYEI